MSHQRKVTISVSTDLTTDQRVQKVATSLKNDGYQVTLIGRKLSSSVTFQPEDYHTIRFNLWVNKGPIFYALLNIRLFLELLFSKQDILYANDLDVLPANYLASKLKGRKLVYDSHEYFTEVPELVCRPRIQKVWESIEKAIVPKLKHCITVTNKIAEVYKIKYNVDFKVVRNFPLYQESRVVEKENVIIYQGALNVGRGLEELIAAMPMINAKLWIAGSGDIENILKDKVKEKGIEDKVIFLGRLETDELRKYTERAKIGVSIERKLGLNYTYALPNKIFDYVQCLTPLLFSDLVEVKKTLNGLELGEELKSYEANTLAEQVNTMISSPHYEKWRSNCKKAAVDFSWQKEELTLLSIFKSL